MLCRVSGGEVVEIRNPEDATFTEAAAIIEWLRRGCDDVLVAADEPVIVYNEDGMRPAERIASRLMRRLGSGVQPAYRNKASMFGDEAPSWWFLGQIGACLNFDHAKYERGSIHRHCDNIVHVIEVYPALVLPTLESAFMAPRVVEGKQKSTIRWAARYNPANAHFANSDWIRVCTSVRRHLLHFGLGGLADWIEGMRDLPNPAKAHQDMVDAVICLLIALKWRYPRHQHEMHVLGDMADGYMVTPVSEETFNILQGSDAG